MGLENWDVFNGTCGRDAAFEDADVLDCFLRDLVAEDFSSKGVPALDEVPFHGDSRGVVHETFKPALLVTLVECSRAENVCGVRENSWDDCAVGGCPVEHGR